MQVKDSQSRVGFPAVCILFILALLALSPTRADPFPPYWNNGAGAAIHYVPTAWPNEPADAADCGANCGGWKPYTRFQNSVNDPRAKDPSNGGTAPQNFVNIASSCVDTDLPSIYYYLHQGATPDEDVIMFRWRVEQIANTYATGPNPGSFGAAHPWSSALWTVLFDIDGSGFRNLAAHINGSSGSPATPIDMLAGIWSEAPNQSLDYHNDPNVHLLGHNPTAFIDDGTNRILNFQNSLTPTPNWPNGAAETSWDYGTTRARLVSTRSCNEYFIDYQIPVAMLDASGLGGPKITRSTPISMMFCTANSLNNPFQKDCAINREWAADSSRPAPFGDYISFNKEAPYSQPIVSSVTATAPAACGQDYRLSAKVQDVLAVVGGEVLPSVKAVDFYYWYDTNGSGLADDPGGSWVYAASATREPGSMNTWNANWNASNLPKGRFLIGVQALDDNTLVDDGMIATGVDNRTFSYLPGDAQSRIHVDGVWIAGQQVAFPSHDPTQAPGATENWYGNPDVTGIQTALVGVAINTCGVAPTLELAVDRGEVGPGEPLAFTLTVSNAGNPNPLSVTSLSSLMPEGFGYQGGSTSGDFGAADPVQAGQLLTWTPGLPLVIAANGSASLSFDATATASAGEYNAFAQADTGFGLLDSAPATVAVGSARLTLGIMPNVYSVGPGGDVSYALAYSNPTSIGVTAATLAVPVPAGTSVQSCTPDCATAGGTVSWILGELAGGATGNVTLVLRVDPAYASTALTLQAGISGQDPAAAPITASASSTLHVNVPIGSIPAFTLEKTASVARTDPGGSVVYSLHYHNYGGAAASDVVLSDPLPAGMAFSSCTGGCAHNTGTVTWSLGAVAAGASGTVSVTVAAANPFTATNPAANTATLGWDGGGPVQASANVGVSGQSCSTYYFRDDTANVGFDGNRRIATALPVPLAGDTGATVTVVAPNSGQPFGEAVRFYQDPATLVDTEFSGNVQTRLFIDRSNGPGLDLRATLNDYDSITGNRVQLGQQTFSFGGNQKGELSFSVPVSGTLEKDHRLMWLIEVRSQHNSQTYSVQIQYNGTVANGISGGSTFANSGASYCVTPPANLSLQKTVDLPSVPENTETGLVYTLRYANNGSTPATNAEISDILPAGVSFVTASLDGAPIVPADANPYVFALGNVAAGASGELIIQATVSPAADGLLTNTASLSSDQTSEIGDAATTLVGTPGGGGGGLVAPALFVAKTADRSLLGADQTVRYSVTVVNAGNGPASNVVITDDFPEQGYFSYDGCVTVDGNCGAVGGVLTWAVGNLAAGAVATLRYDMRTDATGLPDGLALLDNLATLTDDDYCTDPLPASCVSGTVGLSISGNPDLALTLGVSAPLAGTGDTLQYTLTMTNLGSSAASDLMVYGPVPGHTAYLSIDDGTGEFDTVNNRVLYSLDTLAAGAAVTLRYSVRVADVLPSGNTLVTATATATAGNAAARQASATSTVAAAAALELSMSGPANLPMPAATLAGAVTDATSFHVNSTALLGVGDHVRIEGTLTRITAISGNQITVTTPVTSDNGAALLQAGVFNLAYRNGGDAVATGLALEVPLPAGWLYVESTPPAGGAPAVNAHGVLSWDLGDLEPGISGNLRFVAMPVASGAFLTSATLDADGGLQEQASVATLVGGLQVSKSSAEPAVGVGDSAQYSIELRNSLAVPVNGVVVKDVLPAGFTYLAANPLPDGFEDGDAGRPFWTLNVPAQGSVTISLAALVGVEVGPATYQNEVETEAPAGVGVLQFDALATTAEDVTVLFGTGLVVGHVYRGTDEGQEPLAGVWVHFFEDDTLVYSDYSDETGRFQRVLDAGTWRLEIGGVAANQALLAGLNAEGDPVTFNIASGQTRPFTFVFEAAGEPEPEPEPEPGPGPGPGPDPGPGPGADPDPGPVPDQEPVRQEHTLARGEIHVFAPPPGTGISRYRLTRGGGTTELLNPASQQYASVLICADGECRFQATRSGRYEFVFVDGEGERLTLVFHLHPSVAFASAVQYGTPGETVRVRLLLDDLPIEDLAVVPFLVENAERATDPMPVDLFTRAAGVLRFQLGAAATMSCLASGICFKDLLLTPTVDAGEIHLQLHADAALSGATLGSPARHTVRLVPRAQMPLGASLELLPGHTVALGAGVALEVAGLPTAGRFGFAWDASDSALGIGSRTAGAFEFQAPAIAGVYRIRVRVRDLDHPNRSAIELDTWLRVVAPDQLGHYCGGDCQDPGTGIPAGHQGMACGLGEDDPVSHPYRLQVGEDQPATVGLCLETTPGYGLRLGTVSFLAAPRYGAGVQGDAIQRFGYYGREAIDASDPGYRHVGLYYDFRVTRLHSAGQSVFVVVPLPRDVVIPPAAVWRKYHPVNGWVSFQAGDEAMDALHSAQRIGDACPGPTAGQWEAGLVAGHQCVRITLSDGGGNDMDDEPNAVIHDPGTLAFAIAPEPAGGGHRITSGGGAMGPVALLAGGLWLLWRVRRLRPWLAALVLLLPAVAGAEYRDPGWYVGGFGGMAMGEKDGADVTAALQGRGIDATARVEDQDRFAWRLTGGYRFSEAFSLEAGYTDLGKVTTWIDGHPGLDLDTIRGVPPASGRGLDISASLYLPVAEQFDLYGRVGGWYWEARYEVDVTGQTRRPSDGLDLVLGIGLRYWLTPAWQLGLSWDRYRIDAEDVDLLGLGLIFRVR